MDVRRALALTVLLVAGVTAVDLAGAAAGPTPVTTWRSVEAGGWTTCAIAEPGRLYCWGWGEEGQLGAGAVTGADVPTQVAGGHRDWEAVSVGGEHACGIRAGRLWCWGSDRNGRLGNGGRNRSRRVPVQVAGGHADWTAVAAGFAHTCGLRAGGSLWCWGLDLHGRLGDGPGLVSRDVPTRVVGNRWRAVAAGNAHTCGLGPPGRIFCWGSDRHGTGGDGGRQALSTVPREARGDIRDAVDVDAGVSHVCTVRRTGRMLCWGRNDGGQLGDGTAGVGRNQSVPRPVRTGVTDWRSVATGARHTCGVTHSGRLLCWGDGASGEVGDGTTGLRMFPRDITGPTADWLVATAGAGHSCAVRTTGALLCWGDDAYGQLGHDGGAAHAPHPVVDPA